MALHTPYGTLLPPGATPPAPRMPVPTPPAGAAPVTPAPAVPGASPPPSSGGAPGAPGGGNPLFSAFNRTYQNPLFHIGAGLLSQGPSLTPINPWAGLAGGLASFGQARALQAEQERQQAELKMRREEMDWKRQQAEAKTKAATAETAAATRALIAGGMDPALAADVAASGNAGAYLKPKKPAELPAGAQMAEWFVNAPPELQDATLALRRAGAMTISTESKAEQAAAIALATLQAKRDDAEKKLDAALVKRNALQEAFEANESLAAGRLVEEANKEVALARQRLFNDNRELSNAAQEALEPPGPVEQMVSDALDTGISTARQYLPTWMGGTGAPAPTAPTPPTVAPQVAPGAPTPTGPAPPKPAGMSQSDWDELQALRAQQGG